MVPRSLSFTLFAAAALGSWGVPLFGADEAVLKPRVPVDQLEEARTWTNPFPATEQTIEKGKRLFHGKAFCVTCHGKEGKGLGGDIEPGSLKGPLPRDFTDKAWQAARTDGELFWIIEHGVRFTGMPGWSTGTKEGEAASWHLVHFIRHLPDITEAELEDMTERNPRSPEEVRQDVEAERFLRGEDVR